MLVASTACAPAPDIGVMAPARSVQGSAGGRAVVIARSVVDLATESRLVRALDLVQGVGRVRSP